MIVSTTVTTDPPVVAVEVSAMAAGTVSWTLYRDAGSDSFPVRGAQAALVGTGAQVVDREVPVGVAVSYRIATFDSSGAPLDTATVSVAALPDVAVPYMWVSDPLDQTKTRRLHCLTGSDVQRTSSRAVAYAKPSGSKYPIASIGELSRLQEWPLVLFGDTASSAVWVRDLLGNALQLCIRPPAWSQLPPVMYLTVAGVVESFPTGAPDVFAMFAVEGSIVAPSLIDPVVVAWTYDDLEAMGLTYDQVNATFASYNALERGI